MIHMYHKMYANRCSASTNAGKRCKRKIATAEGTCVQHISMYPTRCSYVSPRFNRCGLVAPYGNDYCREHKAAREPIIIDDSESEIITVHDSDSEYIPDSESESNSEYADDEGSDSDDSEWLPYDHKKQKRPVIVEGGASESICDPHDHNDLCAAGACDYCENNGYDSVMFEGKLYGMDDAFIEYIEDEENPNVWIIRDAIVKARELPHDRFNDLVDYLDDVANSY